MGDAKAVKLERSAENCPYRRKELNKICGEINCFYSGGPDAKGERWIYGTCDFKGEKYTECPLFKLHCYRSNI